jgi:lysophospholipase L1-like esterase
MLTKYRIVIGLATVLLFCIAFIVVEALVIKFNGKAVPAPAIDRLPQTFGNGPTLTYVILGDSTSIGQGTDYPSSYAWQTAQHLSQTHQITLVNVGVSGARAADIATSQINEALPRKPDIVLLAVGANDVTHLTSMASLEESLVSIITRLRQENPNVQIVVTGSPAMGSVPRFPWPVKQLAAHRTRQVNAVYVRLGAKYNLVFAPIADKTGPAFLADPSLFAIDKFHPNARGYALWTPVLNDALDIALTRLTAH